MLVKVSAIFSRQIVGVIILVFSVAFWRSATQLPDGPAVVYPQLVIGVLLVLVALDVARTAKQASTGELQVVDPSDASGEGERPVREVTERPGEAVASHWALQQRTIVVAASTAVYLFVLPTVGFYLSSAIYLAFAFYYLGIRRKLQLFLLWVGCLAVFWIVFSYMLNVRLPRGILI